MIILPEIDPIAFSIGPLVIRWYALAYVAGFVVGSWWLTRLTRRHPAPNFGPPQVDSLFVWVVLGVILGGRLGYVLFYNLPHYLENPLAILKTWQGGMSFHGGMLGVVVALFLFAKVKKVHPMDIADRLAVVVPIGLFLGRLANFVNGELWGRPTEVPWGMLFPHDPTGLSRHPSQLYEAALEGIILFALLWAVTRKGIRRWQPSGLFLLGYGLARFVVEFFRQPDPLPHLQGGIFEWMSMGQLLSTPMMFIGLIFLWLAYKK
jgi:phosphatidylglycerol:prolipoprotein diacylglycerol transferase